MRQAPRGLVLDWIDYKAARLAVESWHYSRRMPAGKLAKIGVWEDGRFVGAIIFGMGASCHLLRKYGLTQHQGCELVRVALRDHRNTVTRILSVAMRMIKRKYRGLRLIVSFADPAEGHKGGIYQAGNWIYDGDSDPQTRFLSGGRVVHARTMGSRKESNPSLALSSFQKIRKPGKHRYLMPLDDDMRAQLKERAKPYPKRGRSNTGDAPGCQPGEEGSTPIRPLQNLKEEINDGGATEPQ